MSLHPALLGWFAASVLATSSIRIGLLHIARQLPAWQPAPCSAVIIGSHGLTAALVQQLQSLPDTRYHIVGYFTDNPGPPSALHDVTPYLGSTGHAAGFMSECNVRDVFVALPWSDGARIAATLELLRFLPITARLLPEHVPSALPSEAPHALAGVVMPTLMVPPFSRLDRLLKRVFDVVVATVLLIMFLPLMTILAALIKLDSPGPVLFKQVRTGEFSRSFRILKFRTLHQAQADSRADTLVSARDKRVTRVGAFLRAHSLDELPQMVNVIMGAMSLVGPRPHAARAMAEGQIYTDAMPDYQLRYRVKPGMTGWAQINGWRGNTDTVDKLHRRVECDFQYIQTWSLGLDVYILLRTIPSILVPQVETV